MKRKFTFLTAAFMLLAFLSVPLGMRGQTTYEQLTSIANIDESAQYVLGIDGTGFHYSGTSSWGLTALPSAHTPIYYTLTKANDGNSFTAQATISGTNYYLQVPTSNTFSMATSAGTNTDLIIGTTQVSGTNYAVANKTTTTRHLRLNGTSGLRSYAGTTGTMAYFYKVVAPSGNTHTVTYHANGGTGNDIVETYNEGVDVTVAANTFSYSGHAFTKWNTNSGGTGTDYLPGAVIEDIDDDWDFYAQWEESNETTATLTATNLSLPTGNSYNDNETEVVVDGITYAYNKLKNDNNGNIQAQATYGNIRNTTAYPGDITSVVITHTGTPKESTIYGSVNGTDWTSINTGSGSISADFSGHGYRYFKITRGGNAAYWTKVEINYSIGGGTSLTQSDLTITNASTDLTFDLYPNATAQVINYTTSSTGEITITPASPTTYFSYVHNATAKTITVTPLAVTPSPQTVTIDQAADDDYYAGTATFTVSVANSTPLANIAALTAITNAGNYAVTLTNAVVTYVNGSNAYIQDASGAVAMYKSSHGLTAGDVLNGTASVAYELHNANPQITNLTGVTPVSGTAPVPTEVAQSAWNYTFSDVLSQYFKVTGATITKDNNNNKYYVSLNGENIQLYKSGTAIGDLDLTKTYSITGFPTMYNTTKELQVYADPEVEIGTAPVINANNVSIDYDATSGAIAYTIDNPGTGITLGATCDADWVSNIVVDASSVTFTTTANEGNTDRTATFTLTYTGAENKTVTVTQGHYVVDYAELPFEWEEGDYGTTPTGVTNSGVGAGSSNAYLKFDGTGDYIILKINERPGTLTYEIKANPSNNNTWVGTFKVQTSEDGTDYTDALVYDADNMLDLNSYQTESIATLGENVRYIKWVYTSKGEGNVALKNIALVKYVDPVTIPVINATAGSALAYNATDGSIVYDIDNYQAGAMTATTTAEWISNIVVDEQDEMGEVTFDVTTNTSTSDRTATVTLTFTYDSGSKTVTADVTVTQLGKPAVIIASPIALPATANDAGTIDVTYSNFTPYIANQPALFDDDACTTSFTGDWLDVSFATISAADDYYHIDYMVAANTGAARTAYMKVEVMDENSVEVSTVVTITQAAYSAPGTWVLTSLAELTPADVFVIVGNNGATYALPNDGGATTPLAVAISVGTDALTDEPAANLQWNLSVSESGYVFYPAGSTTSWLYLLPDNNAGVRIGTGDAKHFTLDPSYNYLTTTETTYQRYIGIFSSQDWRCYKLNGDAFPTNIAGQTFAFYKKVSADVTYKKENIAAYTGANDHYNLIASPVASVDPATAGSGFLTSAYDLYYFDESQGGFEWRNYEATSFNLVSGKGYLYASSTLTNLTFTGQPYNGNGLVELAFTSTQENQFAGWNLIGNPFATAATLNRPFYKMNDDGNGLTALIEDLTNTIAAMEGVFVKATAASETAIFTAAQSKGGNQAIAKAEISVIGNRGSVIDNAIIRFDNGETLEKFVFGNPAANIYFAQNGKEYAIIRSEARGEMPVNFKAAETGTYTISVEAENLDMNYLHLIDNMTGMDVDLLATPSYTFEGKKSDYASRFKLVFSANADDTEMGDDFAFINDGNIIILNEGEATLQVIDIMGRIVSTQTVNGNASVNSVGAAGVYVLQLINGNNVKTQKIVVR